MPYMLKLYWAHFKVHVAIKLQYRVASALWMIGAVIQPTIYLVVWATVARTQGGEVGGLNVGDFAAYYLTLMFLEHLTFTWFMWEYDFRIREGHMSRLLLLPIHPIHADLMENVAYKLLGLVLMIPAGIGLGWTFRPNFNFQFDNLLLFIPAFLLAFTLRFCMGYVLALIAFWSNRIQAINNTYFVVHLFLSGRLSPIELLPAPLFAIAAVLPFRWVVAYPIELFIGQLTRQEALQGLAAQAAWTVAIVLLLRAVWQRGVRKYAAFGG